MSIDAATVRESILLGMMTLSLLLGSASETGEARRPSLTVDVTHAFDSMIEAQARGHGIAPLLARQITLVATEHDVPLNIAFALVREESSFRPDAVSHAGAIGLTQVKVMTARIYDEDATAEDLIRSPRQNLAAGYAYLSDLEARFGSWRRALAAYNAGPTRHARAGRTGEYNGHAYARRVLR